MFKDFKDILANTKKKDQGDVIDKFSDLIQSLLDDNKKEKEDLIEKNKKLLSKNKTLRKKVKETKNTVVQGIGKDEMARLIKESAEEGFRIGKSQGSKQRDSIYHASFGRAKLKDKTVIKISSYVKKICLEIKNNKNGEFKVKVNDYVPTYR